MTAHDISIKKPCAVRPRLQGNGVKVIQICVGQQPLTPVARGLIAAARFYFHRAALILSCYPIEFRIYLRLSVFYKVSMFRMESPWHVRVLDFQSESGSALG